MASLHAVEVLKTIITSYFGRDDASFDRAIEGITRQLTLENRVGEAKQLRDILLTARKHNEIPRQMQALPKAASPLIAIRPPDSHEKLFFDSATEASLNQIIAEQRGASLLAESGLRPKNKLLFWGPPGCGKTAAASWIAESLGLQLGVVRLASLITSYVGETGSNIQKVFSIADQTPMVLLLDEADAVAKSRDDENDVGELRRVVNTLLQSLDLFSSGRSVIIFATNHSFLFDTAVWRRFDDVVRFSPPRFDQRLSHLKYLVNGVKVAGSLDRVAKEMDGFSFADIKRAVLEVAKRAVLTKKSEIPALSILQEAQQWEQKTKDAAKRPVRNR